MNHDLELKLQAWLDGELTAAEARSIGREIAADADASRLVTELQAIKSTLAGNELPMPLPESREFFWSKIERQIQREAVRRTSGAGPRLGSLAQLDVAAGRLCGVDLHHSHGHQAICPGHL